MSETKCKRHFPTLFRARVEQRRAMSARCWSVCKNCKAEIHRADGEPWAEYIAPASMREVNR